MPRASGFVLTVLIASGATAQERHTHSSTGSLGEVAFANSGAAAAQRPFLRGLALLHSFEYGEAADAFEEAIKHDRSFAMAYWAEALTYLHPLWGEDDPAAARRVLARLAPTPAARLARAGTVRERAYGGAVEALFQELTLAGRIQAFADSMRKLSAAYPDDVDAAAFTALALMMVDYDGGGPPAERAAARTEAITIAARIFKSHPRHPGSTHYLIHATDDPRYAARGLEAAKSYAELAPDAEHALHMPSHIFLQLGLWAENTASNERAWAASRREVENRKLSPADLSFHALQWLQYAYLQQGRAQAARALIDTARAVLGLDQLTADGVDARYVIPQLEFMYAAHSGDWSGTICDRSARPFQLTPATSDRERGFQGMVGYQAAVAAIHCGATSSPALEFARERMQRVQATDLSRPMLATTLLHVEVLLAMRRGEFARAAELLGPSARAPSRPPVGPPGTFRTHELLGDALLQGGRPADAVAAYQRALELTPNRSAALLGLARAARAAGDPTGSADAYRRLAANWVLADPTLPGLAEARASGW